MAKRKHRSNLEIYHDILKIAIRGSKKSHLVYKANLNFKIIKDYINELVANDLIVVTDAVFKTTQKGIVFVKQFENMADSGLLCEQLG